MLTFFLIILMVIALVPYIVQLPQKGINFFRPDVFITTVFCLYTFPIPIDMLIFGNTQALDEDLVIKGLILTILWLFSFLIGYYTYVLRPKRYYVKCHKDWMNDDCKIIAWSLILFGGILYLIYIFVYYGDIVSYLKLNRVERFYLKAGLGYLTIGLPIFNTGVILLFSDSMKRLYLLKNGKRKTIIKNLTPYIIFFILYTTFFLLSGDRRLLVSFILGIAFVYCKYVFDGQLGFKQAFFTFFISLSALILLQIFSKIRVYASQPLSMYQFFLQNFRYEWLNLAQGELGTQFKILTDLVRDITSKSFMLGSTYLNAVVAQIPSSIYPERPMSPGSWYCQTYYPNIFLLGGGVGFSFIGEAYLNFGTIGPVVVGYIVGLILGWWYRNTGENRNSSFHIALYGGSLGLMFIIARSDTVSILKEFLFGLFLPLAIMRIFLRLIYSLIKVNKGGKPRLRCD